MWLVWMMLGATIGAVLMAAVAGRKVGELRELVARERENTFAAALKYDNLRHEKALVDAKLARAHANRSKAQKARHNKRKLLVEPSPMEAAP